MRADAGLPGRSGQARRQQVEEPAAAAQPADARALAERPAILAFVLGNVTRDGRIKVHNGIIARQL